MTILCKIEQRLESIEREEKARTREAKETNRLLRKLIRIELNLPPQDNVTGGKIFRIGDTMNAIAPGSTVKFLVAPTFSGPPFPLVGSQAAVNSSDPVNFPVTLDLTDDPTGATFECAIPPASTPIGASGEVITITWQYTNEPDGVVATVSGTVTEQGIVDDVTGGTFTQIQ